MELIVNELAEILKRESNEIEKEAAMAAFLKEVTATIVTQALQLVDDSLIAKQKAQGYRIEKQSQRMVVTTLGEIPVKRRRYVSEDGTAAYPLDDFMGWTKYKRYSPLLVRNLGELATTLTYRAGAKVVELLAPFTVSHQKMNELVNQVGQELKKQQTADQRYDAFEKPKTAPKALFIEGDAFLVKGQGNKWLEVHRYQVCEGLRWVGKKRKERVNARDFVSLGRQTAMKEMIEYLGNTYDMKQTTLISNGDGGSGYTKEVFDELCGAAARHEFFLDSYHVNRKIKERLCFALELHEPLMQALWRDYDQHKVECLLDTAESLLIEELDTAQNREHLRLLRNYLERNWAHIKPFPLRGLKGIPKAIGAIPTG